MIYRFGPYQLDTERLELTASGEPVAVQPQVFSLLAFLIENRDRAVSKDEIIDAVWGGRIVSDGTLNARINAARRALGDDGNRQAVIRTLPRRGFRFVAELRPDKDQSDAALIAADSGADIVATKQADETVKASISTDAMFQRPALAVLPFTNMSGDADQEYFADGLTEDIITALSLWRAFPVIARNSTFAFKGQQIDVREIGKELGARFVVEGSVRRAGNRLRVTAQLNNAETGHHIWAEHYDRELADIFTLQDELSRQIAAIVAPEVQYSRAAATRLQVPQSLEAWDLVQRGYATVFAFDDKSIATGRDFFEQAIKLDPDYARAWIGLAWSYHREIWLFRERKSDEIVKQLSAAAERAVVLDDLDSEAHVLMALAQHWRQGGDHGIAEAKRAIELNPNSTQAHVQFGVQLSVAGRPNEAIASVEKAILLSPRDPRQGVWMWLLGFAYLTARDYTEARLWTERAIQRNAANFDAHLVLASTLGHLGQVEQAHSSVEAYLDKGPRDWEQRNPIFRYDSQADEEHFLEGLRKAGMGV